MFNLDTGLLMQAFGLIFIGLGVAARIGYWKKWFWQVRSSIYGYIPFGCIFILSSFNEALKKAFAPNEWIIFIFYGVLLAIGIWFSARPPLFIKPIWVRWIDKYPENIIEAMRSAAKEDPDWESHIKSEETVDVWAKSLKASKGRKTRNTTTKG